MLLVGAAAVALVSGSEGGAGREPGAPPPPPRAGRTASVPAVGISARPPLGWSASRSSRALTMRSPGRAMAIAVVAPRGATGSARLLRSAASELRRRYRVERAGPGDGQKLAGLPTSSIVVTARSRRTRVRLRVLVAAVQGRRRAWLVEVFFSAGAPTARLAEGQVALNSLRLRG